MSSGTYQHYGLNALGRDIASHGALRHFLVLGLISRRSARDFSC